MHHILTLTCSRRLSVRDPLVFLWLSRRLPSSSCSLVWFSNLSFSAEFKTSCSFSFITLAPTIFSIKACCAALHCVMPAKGAQVAQTIMTIRETMDHSARRAIIQLQVLWAELDLAILRKTQTKATVWSDREGSISGSRLNQLCSLRLGCVLCLWIWVEATSAYLQCYFKDLISALRNNYTLLI